MGVPVRREEVPPSGTFRLGQFAGRCHYLRVRYEVWHDDEEDGGVVFLADDEKKERRLAIALVGKPTLVWSVEADSWEQASAAWHEHNGDDGPVRRVELPELIGLTDTAATQIATDRGIERVRVLQCVDGMTVTPMTMEWDLGRLNLAVEGGVVVSAVFG